jgi:hypothetical protein
MSIGQFRTISDRFILFLAKMANAVIKKYACNHNELLTDRVSYVADDIETFLSMTFMSPAATMFVLKWFLVFLLFFTFFFFFSNFIRAQPIIKTTTSNEKEREKFGQIKSNIVLDENSYKRASINDFFSQAFGPSKSELKPNQPHSLRSTFEHIAGDFIEKPARGAKRETLATIKEEMRKKKIRIDTKT